MRRWPEALSAAALALCAAPAAAQDTAPLTPAPQASIVNGGKACIGVTVDPAGQSARMQGWSAMAPAEAQKFTKEGDVLTRDHVVLVYKTGVDGGCVVIARADPAFDKAKFYADVSAVAGVTVAPSDQPAKVDLPNGEMLLVIVTPQDAQQTLVQLIIANPAGKYAKKGN